MRAEDHSTSMREMEGWAVRLTSYRVGTRYYCTVDNVDPGAWIARSEGATRQEAEAAALEQAQRRLARTRRMPAV